MKDREFLLWLHDRMVLKHRENELADYMHKLRAIIANTPADHESVNTGEFYSADDLRLALAARGKNT